MKDILAAVNRAALERFVRPGVLLASAFARPDITMHG